MPIQVTCSGCLTRFQVSDKFAGKRGPCPKCKAIITIPAVTEQVVVHEPEPEGPKDRSGRPVFTPILRQETRLTGLQAGLIIGAVLLVLIVALLLRLGAPQPGAIEPFITVLGSILLAPGLVLAGYAFLRDDELEPYRGPALWLRAIPCSVVYPLLWGVYWLIFAYLDLTPEYLHLLFVVPGVVALGAITAMASLELEVGPACLHYGLYLVATLLLRLLLGMHGLWNTVT